VLTQRCRYAIKALLNLADSKVERPKSGRAIAAEEGIPLRFLRTILTDLCRFGLIQSSSGREGGFWLAQPPEKITFGLVVRLMDGSLALLPCAEDDVLQRCRGCPDHKPCELRQTMAFVYHEVSNILDSATLSSAAWRTACAPARLVELVRGGDHATI
jgi:Rrf2 family protein